MTFYEDKEFLIKAINNYTILSDNQRKILVVLVSFEQGAPSDIIMKYSGLSKQALHFAVKKLISQGVVSREKNRVYVYKAAKVKLLEIIDFYKQQLLLEQK